MSETEDIEKRRASVQLEVEKMKEEVEKKGERLHFNNFWAWLNHPRSRRYEVGDKTNFPQKYFIDENKVMTKRASNPITYKAYFELIDDLVRKLGLNERIQQLVSDEWNHLLPDEVRKKAEYDLQEALIPLYIELRLLDFSDHDICF